MNRTTGIWARTAMAVTVVTATALLPGCSLLNGFIGGTSVEGEGNKTDIFAIAIGDCLNDAAADGTVSEVPTVPCTEPHDSEVFASVILEDGDFPGEEAIIAEADSGCLAQFAAFMGIEYEASTADIQYYFPTDVTWLSGDREILCLVYATDGAGNTVQTTGSLAGSGI
jgi:hypothetical protein